jgi:DNA uptake protein ComE-like DNA-binding protein
MSPLLSILWALVPLATLGWGTGFSFAYAAIRLRDAVLGWCAAAYFVVGALSFALVATSNSQGGDWRGTLGTFLILALIALGSAHAFGIRKYLVDPSAPRRGRKVVSVQEQALAEARTEMQRRSEARQILTADPELARQLCIGRPDLPRRYQDGGLVDANHAPASVLARLPGIDSELSDRIVANRETVDGFRDVSDMSITLGVAPQTLDEASTFLVFPRSWVAGQ